MSYRVIYFARNARGNVSCLWMTHTDASVRYAITASDNDLSDWRQAIIQKSAELLSMELNLMKYKHASFQKRNSKCRLQNVGHLVIASVC